MVRLNKHKLSDAQLDQLFVQLHSVLAKLDATNSGVFLGALLGREERIMLAKRLGIVVMLLEGYSMYKIAHTLHVSPTTVEKINTAMSEGTYDALVPLLKKHKVNYQAIISVIDSILTVGGTMPRYGQARLPKNI